MAIEGIGAGAALAGLYEPPAAQAPVPDVQLPPPAADGPAATFTPSSTEALPQVSYGRARSAYT